MGQILHGSATTTKGVSRAIRHHEEESIRTLASRCRINAKTVGR